MINKLQEIQGLFLEGYILEFHLLTGYSEIKVFYDKDAKHDWCKYSLMFRHKNFEEYECASNPKGILDRINELIAFVEEVSTTPHLYRKRMENHPLANCPSFMERVNQNIKEIKGEM